MDVKHILQRLQKIGSDDKYCETKECNTRLSLDVWESVSAFANTEGGTLLLGVSEKNGFVPVEHFKLEAVLNQFVDGMGDAGSKGVLTNAPQYSIERVEIDDEPVLCIEISALALQEKPCYITARGVQNGSFKRVDDRDVKLSPDEVYSMQTAWVPCNADREVVADAVLTDLDKDVYHAVFKRAEVVSPRAIKGALTDEHKLQRLGFLDSKNQVTTCGLLCAGYYPQQFFPRLFIDVAVHPGLDKAGAGSLRFADRVLCEGSIGDMIDDAYQAVTKNLRTISRIEGMGRVDELEIPEGAVREAMANAVVHREYSSRFLGMAIQVDIYDDRMEVTNPGGLWGKSIKEIDDGNSTCRNASLMKMLNLVPIPSIAGPAAEGNGTGVQYIKNECAKRGLAEPQFIAGIDYFKVVFTRRNGIMGCQRHSSSASVEDVYAFIVNAPASISDIQRAFGLTRRQVQTRIEKLLKEGRIEPTAAPRDPTRKYRAV